MSQLNRLPNSAFQLGLDSGVWSLAEDQKAREGEGRSFILLVSSFGPTRGICLSLPKAIFPVSYWKEDTAPRGFHCLYLQLCK